MKKQTVPIVVYRNGLRYVVAEAMVEVPEDIEDFKGMECDISEPTLTKIRASAGDTYSLPKE